MEKIVGLYTTGKYINWFSIAALVVAENFGADWSWCSGKRAFSRAANICPSNWPCKQRLNLQLALSWDQPAGFSSIKLHGHTAYVYYVAMLL